jgi:hypothetical protein
MVMLDACSDQLSGHHRYITMQRKLLYLVPQHRKNGQLYNLDYLRREGVLGVKVDKTLQAYTSDFPCADKHLDTVM